jgi:hypothetical protein
MTDISGIFGSQTQKMALHLTHLNTGIVSGCVVFPDSTWAVLEFKPQHNKEQDFWVLAFDTLEKNGTRYNWLLNLDRDSLTGHRSITYLDGLNHSDSINLVRMNKNPFPYIRD